MGTLPPNHSHILRWPGRSCILALARHGDPEARLRVASRAPPVAASSGTRLHPAFGHGTKRIPNKKKAAPPHSNPRPPPTTRKANGQPRIQSTPIAPGFPARNNLDEYHVQCPALTSSPNLYRAPAPVRPAASV